MTAVPPTKLLVVEDDADIRETLVLFLQDDEGFEVDAVETLDAAVASIATQTYGFILTDLFGKNSIQALDAISPLVKQVFPTPVGLLTAHRLQPKQDISPFAFVLYKPFNIDELSGRIAPHLHTPVTAEHDRATAVITRFFEAVNQQDADGAARLCAEEVVFYPPANASDRAPIQGRTAYRHYSARRFQTVPSLHVSDVTCYPLPKGRAVRYTIHWHDPQGAPQQVSVGILFQVEDAQIQQIGVRDWKLLRQLP